jgi:hypothetical protein
MPTRSGTSNLYNLPAMSTTSNMTADEVFDALQQQLNQQVIEQTAERVLLRQELTSNSLMVSRLALTLDRLLGPATPSAPAATPVFSRLLARFNTTTTPGLASNSSPPPTTSMPMPPTSSASMPTHTTLTTPVVVPPSLLMPPTPSASMPTHTTPTTPAVVATSDELPRIRRSEKIQWPKCPSSTEPTVIKGWRMKFLATINTCDLASLFDPGTHDLVLSHPDVNAVKVLYGIIQASLPDGHPMILNRSYWGLGLHLWHAFSATVIPALTFHKRQELIQTLFHHTTRLNSEDVYSYYNRLATDVDDINCGSYPPSITQADLRRRFLFSLGPEFDYLKVDDIEGRLDPDYLTTDIEPLLYRLQGILNTKRVSMAILPTISSSGYANAIKEDDTEARLSRFSLKYGYANAIKKDDTDARLNTLAEVVGDIHSQLALLRVPTPAFAAALVAPASAPTSTPTHLLETQFYCWSHGVCKHHGVDCTRPLANHKPKATFSNRMGGSSYVKQYKE